MIEDEAAHASHERLAVAIDTLHTLHDEDRLTIAIDTVLAVEFSSRSLVDMYIPDGDAYIFTRDRLRTLMTCVINDLLTAQAAEVMRHAEPTQEGTDGLEGRKVQS